MLTKRWMHTNVRWVVIGYRQVSKQALRSGRKFLNTFKSRRSKITRHSKRLTMCRNQRNRLIMSRNRGIVAIRENRQRKPKKAKRFLRSWFLNFKLLIQTVTVGYTSKTGKRNVLHNCHRKLLGRSSVVYNQPPLLIYEMAAEALVKNAVNSFSNQKFSLRKKKPRSLEKKNRKWTSWNRNTRND